MNRVVAAFGIILALWLCGTMPASAKAYADQGEAHAACQAALSALRARAPAYYQTQTWRVNKACAATPVNATTAGYTCSLDLPGVTSCASGGGGNINTDENGGSELYEYPLNALCSTRDPVYAGYQGAGEKQCGKGCEYTADSTPTERVRVDQARSTAINFQRGRWVPTGAVCASTNPTLPPPRDDYCADLAGGYKMCRNSRGQQCVVSPKTGRKYCANNTDGLNATNPERTENVTKTPESPAPGIPTTPITPRPNEDWKETTKATVTNVTNNTVSNTSISGNAGTPNTNPGDGNPGDGSGNPGEPSEGEGDGDDGSASGGADCNAPPSCSGDPIGCAVLDQTWRNRCAATKGDSNGDGRPDWTELGEGEGDNGPEPGNGDEVAQTWGMEALLDKVDDSGFIGASCPAIPPLNLGPLGSFEVGGEWWCETLELIGGIFVFIASCGAIRILVS